MPVPWRYAVRGACAFVVLALLFVVPAEGQVIEEGYPTKPVFPEEPPAAPHLHEECGPFLDSVEFAEECTGDNEGPGVVGSGSQGQGAPVDLSDPAFRTPPRLECPSAVFLDELETGAIDCHASDAAGEEHLDYRWEPIGGASRDYLENPRLIPEDAPNPMVVAPSSPQYEALETFLSEEGTQRYRYRLTATSRATGLSSHAEVEVFVLSSRPEVYCPLEVAVEEGATAPLACEGADPLSFRMEDGPGDAPVLWEWEGLWGASTAPLTAADTPQPLFTAPVGSAGATYHYVASMTTHSSGVARTARRRVSVTVVESEAPGMAADVSLSVSNALLTITCTNINAQVEDHLREIEIDCRVSDPLAVPSDAMYTWKALSPAEGLDRLVAGKDSLTPTFEIDYAALPNNGAIEYQYEVTLSASSIADVTGSLGVTLHKGSNKIRCSQTYYTVYTGTEDFQFDCEPSNPAGRTTRWDIGYSPHGPANQRVYVPGTETRGPGSVVSDKFDLFFDPPPCCRPAYYTYVLCMYYEKDGGGYRYVDSEQITVEVKQLPEIFLQCDPKSYYIEEGTTVTFGCKVHTVAVPPGASLKYEWTGVRFHAGPELSAKNVLNPTFTAPLLDAPGASSNYVYDLTVSLPSIPQTTPKVYQMVIAIRKAPKPEVIIDCPGNPYEFTEGDYHRELGDCTVEAKDIPRPYTLKVGWTPLGSTPGGLFRGRTDIRRPIFKVPYSVDADVTYEFSFTATVEHADLGTFSDSEDVTVHVRDRAQMTLSCGPLRVYEGSGDHALPCVATDIPPRAFHPPAPHRRPSYRWSPSDGRLAAASPRWDPPVFRAPENVDADETQTYDLTISAEGEQASSQATVTVLNKTPLSLSCSSPPEVYEGASAFALSCAASGLADASLYRYEWTALGGSTDLGLLSATTVSSPMFSPPASVDADQAHEYRLTVSAEHADDATADVTVTVLNRPQLAVTCAGHPYSAYEGSAAFALSCSASGLAGSPDPSLYTYAWSARASSSDLSLLSATDVSSPLFTPPPSLDADQTHEYTLTVTAANAESGAASVDVTVLNNHALSLLCADPAAAYEGSPAFALPCVASSAPALPAGSSYAYSWSSLGAPEDANLLSAGAAGKAPVFSPPPDVVGDRTYSYTITATADHADAASDEVTVTVLDRPQIAVACAGDPYSAYAGSGTIALSCTASGVAGNAPSDYDYAWTARGAPSDTDLLSATDVSSPAFAVPATVASDQAYEYLVTASSANAEAGVAEVTVTVLKRPAIVVSCASPEPVYEGASDVTLSCTATGAPDGSSYDYAWTARGDTPDTGLLSATDVLSPSFSVPGSVARTTRYEYTLTATAANAEAGTDEVTVTVLNEGAIALSCPDPDPVYEGSSDLALSCTASGAPAGSSYAYSWTGRGSTPDASRLSSSSVSSPTFYVPSSLTSDATYEYAVRATAANAEAGAAEVTVTVLKRPAIVVSCDAPSAVYEGSSDIALSCTASGAPGEAPSYAYSWTPRGSTADTGLLSAADVASPAFLVPADVLQTTTYDYLLTARAANAEAGSAEVTVTVLNKGALSLACSSPSPVYEGSGDLALSCSASGGPEGSVYDYAWTSQGALSDLDLLSAADVSSPAFLVPEDVAATTTYAYLVTARAANAEDAAVEVTVTVLDKERLALACANPAPVYEGSADVALSCAATGAPEGSSYDYAWTPLGAAADAGLLSAADISSPTFLVPEDVAATTTYAYLVTARAANAEDASAEVRVTVLDSGVLTLACAVPAAVYEGSPDVALSCSVRGGPEGSVYAYAWTPLGAAADVGLLSAANVSSPSFAVPEDVARTTTYAYTVTASAANAEDATAEVRVTVLNKEALALGCASPDPVYEGSPDIALDCSVTGAPEGSSYEYAWTAQGAAADTDLLSATDVSSPLFAVPEDVAATTTYDYLVTARAANAEDATAEVRVTVLNKEALALACASPDPVYEGSPDLALSCAASGAPEGSAYEYAWTPRGAESDIERLSAANVSSPAFFVPAEVEADETYAYLVTATAANAEAASAEVRVTVLDRAAPPVAFADASEGLGVWASASPLRFGVQSSDTQVSLDALTDRISTSVSGPYHAGRLTLAPYGDLSLEAAAETVVSIEMSSPVTLRRAGPDTTALALVPMWSLSSSCEHFASQSIVGLHTQARLTGRDDCRLLLFGGAIDLMDAPSGRYAGHIELTLRSGAAEETRQVPVSVTVVAPRRVIAIGPGGVRFDASRELPLGLTAEQTLRIYPDVAYLTRENPSGAFELSNPSLIPLELSLSAHYGYAEATEDGRETVVEDSAGARLGDLSSLVEIYPQTLTLMPGARAVVRYGVREEALAEMEERGYAAFFDVSSSPRQYVRSDQLPEPLKDAGAARVTMRVPAAYAAPEGPPQLSAALLSVAAGPAPSATFLVATHGAPFLGEVAAYDADGRELGRRRLLVYTRSRVRMPLERMPEGDVVLLRFTPSGAGEASEPVAVPWTAPQRSEKDIGAAVPFKK